MEEIQLLHVMVDSGIIKQQHVQQIQLDETSKSLIDYHTWNTGAPNYNELYNSTTKTLDTVEFYKAERGTVNGKICTSGTYCNDTVTRTTEWTGYIALPYVTDWAYASSENDCNTKIDQIIYI